jgi:hypothetical protein
MPYYLTTNPSGITVTTPDTGALIKGNKSAASTDSADVTLGSSVTRTAGNLLSIRNAGVELLSFDFAGNTIPGASFTKTLGTAARVWGAVFTTALYDNGTVPRLTLSGNTANVYRDGEAAPGATSIAHILNTRSLFGTVGSQLLSIQNNSVEKCYFDKDGSLWFGAKGAETAVIYSSGSTNFMGTLVSGSQISTSTATPVTLLGTTPDGATAVGSAILSSSSTMATPGAKIVSVKNNTVEKLAIDKDGKSVYPTGGSADVVGTATLVAGTVTVATTAVTAASKIFVTVNTPGGTPGFISVPTASIVAGTSFVINSSNAADTSTINWWIIN